MHQFEFELFTIDFTKHFIKKWNENKFFGGHEKLKFSSVWMNKKSVHYYFQSIEAISHHYKSDDLITPITLMLMFMPPPMLLK